MKTKRQMPVRGCFHRIVHARLYSVVCCVVVLCVIVGQAHSLPRPSQEPIAPRQTSRRTVQDPLVLALEAPAPAATPCLAGSCGCTLLGSKVVGTHWGEVGCCTSHHQMHDRAQISCTRRTSQQWNIVRCPLGRALESAGGAYHIIENHLANLWWIRLIIWSS